MTEEKYNFSDEKKSSLQKIDFSSYSKEKVMEKYEEILIQRERHILELSKELGELNEKNSKANDRISYLENENKILNNKMIKKDNLLKQELTDKEIMFIKLQNLEKENDMLHERVNNFKGFNSIFLFFPLFFLLFSYYLISS